MNTTTQQYNLKKRGTQVKGFWVSKNKTPILFIPRTARVFDGKKFDKSKPSILIIGEALAACDAIDKKGQKVEIEKGDTIGVWCKPGMRDIEFCKGVPTFVVYTHDLDIDKGNPMKVFDVRSEDGGQPLLIEYDARIFSINAETVLQVSPNARRPKGPPSRDDGERRANARPPKDDDYADDDDVGEAAEDDDMSMMTDPITGKPLF